MKRFPKLLIILGVICFFLWSSAASAFELLYEKEGKKYYRTDAGEVISKEIPEGTTGLVFLHQERDGRKKYYQAPDGRILVAEQYGGILSSAPDYNWWYGCSATSAGMMMGYYDINGYDGLGYPNLVPGGIAELDTYPPGAPSGTYIAQAAIASDDHIADFWGDPDPLGSGRTRPDDYDCCADFMCTSSNQSPCTNSDGGTTFFYWVNGSPFTAADAVSNGVQERSGMYGIGEYMQYAGYDYVSGTLFNQYGDFMGETYGYTLAQFQNEIDSGRPLLVHVVNHTMFGYGYAGNEIYVYDTWDLGGGTMTWGSSYSGLGHIGITQMTPSGGEALFGDELAVDFGTYGLWHYDGSWTSLAGWNPDGNMEVWTGSLAVDFGVTYGLWNYDGSSWTSLAGWNPADLEAYGTGLAADFDTFGLWYYDGSSWTSLAGWNPDGNMQVWTGGLAVDFGATYGLWNYDGASWTSLAGWNPADLEAYGTGLAADFDTFGLWYYDGSSWTSLAGWNPEGDMVEWTGGLAVDFGSTYGLWNYDGSSWSSLAGWNPAGMKAYGTGLAVDFDTFGLWYYDGSSWTSLAGWDPDGDMVEWTGGLAVDFGSTYGLWNYNGSSWSSLAGWDPEDMEDVDLN